MTYTGHMHVFFSTEKCEILTSYLEPASSGRLGNCSFLALQGKKSTHTIQQDHLLYSLLNNQKMEKVGTDIFNSVFKGTNKVIHILHSSNLFYHFIVG